MLHEPIILYIQWQEDQNLNFLSNERDKARVASNSMALKSVVMGSIAKCMRLFPWCGATVQ